MMMLLLTAATLALCQHVAGLPPNFILLMSDDTGWGDVSYNNVSSRIHNPGAGGEKFVVNPPRTPELDAMAKSENSILFHRFYAGSAVCSPTRASALTGRTSTRECIDGAEGCGQAPAWSCGDNLPLSPRTFTIAEAAKKKGYATVHIGKWHLGNFFPKPGVTRDNWENNKWPTSSPRTHGFDEWHSTEASASSSMCNCGCDPAWASSPGGDLSGGQGTGCITGGGNFSSKTYACTNYWSPVDLSPTHTPTNPLCASALNATLDGCTANMTTKIMGDDSLLMMDQFEEFLIRKAPGGKEEAPFLAVLWLHTNHMPHPSMPEWFHSYTDANGQPAGDYLGTLSQMDHQIGRLRAMLKTHNVADNTALWFTADNGPHTSSGGGCSGPFARSSNQATNGLRQCKASLFEGGIREPGILEWPAMIKAHRETTFPAYVSDYLPTFLDVVGITHEEPTWAADGISLMPFIRQTQEQTAVDVVANRTKPLGFQLGGQQAWIDNEWKVVRNPSKGQCKTMLPPYSGGGAKGTFMFNLVTDPTESHDLSKDPAHAGRFATMTAALDKWIATITVSQVSESECAQAGSGPSPSPGPSPGPSPMPPQPPSTGFTLKVNDGTDRYLTLDGLGQHAKAQLGDKADGGSKWLESPPDATANEGDAALAAATVLSNAAPSLAGSNVLKLDLMDRQRGGACVKSNVIWVGKAGGGNSFSLVPSSGGFTLHANGGCDMCAVEGTEMPDIILGSCDGALVFTRS